MTNQEMVAALDAVIDRWTRARAILASLEETGPAPETLGAAAEQEHEEAGTALATPVQVTGTVPAPGKSRERRRRTRSHAPAGTALAGAVPSRPVVVSAMDAARHRERGAAKPSGPAEREPALAERGFSLDDLVREVEARRQRPVAS